MQVAITFVNGKRFYVCEKFENNTWKTEKKMGILGSFGDEMKQELNSLLTGRTVSENTQTKALKINRQREQDSFNHSVY